MAKILLVEDEPSCVEFVSTWLEWQGYEMHTVTDGEKALERMSVERFDLILLDWNLPKISGVKVLKEYRRQGNRTPVIMLTDRRNINDKELGLDNGADDYVPKPFQLAELSARIRALLRRYSLAAC